MNILIEIFGVIRDWLALIPSAIWGVIAGAILTNRSQSNRMERQFAHERSVKNKDRSLSLKKEIYLDAAKSLNECIVLISQLPTMNIPDEEVAERFSIAFSVNVKVHMVGEQITLNTYMDLTGSLLAAYTSLLEKRIPLRIKYRESQEFTAVLTRIEKDIDAQLEHMKNYNLNAENNPSRMDSIQTQFQLSNKQKSELLRKRADFERAFAVDRIDFSKECFDAAIKLSGAMAQLVVLVRDEIDTPIFADDYIEMMRRHAELSHERTISFMQRIRDNLSSPSVSQ